MEIENRNRNGKWKTNIRNINFKNKKYNVIYIKW
jgi:hypothetical protein